MTIKKKITKKKIGKKATKKSSKRTSSKKLAKRSTKRNPTDYYRERTAKMDNEEVESLQKYYPGTLTPTRLRKLKDRAYEIDKLYRNGKMKQWEKEDSAFGATNGKLAGILLESAQADSCPYAAKDW